MLDKSVTDNICKLYDIPVEKYDHFYYFCKKALIDKKMTSLGVYNDESIRIINNLIENFIDVDINFAIMSFEREIAQIIIALSNRISSKRLKQVKNIINLQKREIELSYYISCSKKDKKLRGIMKSKKVLKNGLQNLKIDNILADLEKEKQKIKRLIKNRVNYIFNIIIEFFYELFGVDKINVDRYNIKLIIGYIAVNGSDEKVFYNLEKVILVAFNKNQKLSAGIAAQNIQKVSSSVIDNENISNKNKPNIIQTVHVFKNKINKNELSYVDYLIELNLNESSFVKIVGQDFIALLSSNIDKFISRLKVYSYFIHANFSGEDLKYLVSLKDVFKQKLINLKDNQILVSVLIQDIWDTCTNNTDYNVDERLEQLRNNSQKYFLQYIEKDPMYIKNIENPSFSLQKLAVIKNPNSINLIKKPDDRLLLQIYKDKNFADYVKQHQEKIDSAILMNVKLKLAKFVENSTDNNGVFMILNSDVAFDCYIKAIFDLYVIEKFYVATGYTFASGLQLLNKEFSELLADNGELCFIIGSLQHYPLTKNLIQGMDKQTAMALNDLLAKKCRLKTCTTNFYHGKMYYIQTRNFAITIMGSTNFSRTAFQRNKELDTLFYYKDNQQNPFFSWFDKFWTDCTEIKYLEESRFSDVVNPNAEIESNLETISIDEMKSKIAMLSNEELRERLSYWMNYNPSNIFDHVDIAGKDYIAIEYLSRKLIVLESFYEGNAYYAFRDSDIQEVLAIIKGKTKTEIGKLPKMAERGYHIQDIAKIKLKIKALFMQNPNR